MRNSEFNYVTKKRKFLAVLMGSALLFLWPFQVFAAETTELMPDLAKNAKAAVLMDAGTGTVFYAKNEHARLPIASVTKVMTMLLVFEAIERNQVHLSDLVRTSDHAASMGGSQIFLEPKETMTLSDLMKGIAMASANDAAVAVAEHVAGSEVYFVQKMNEKSHALKLHDTHFVNTNGLPIANHYSSAYDIAVISRELMRHDAVTRYTASYSDHLRKSSGHPFWLVNTNKLVRYYSGMDGVKTGYTADSLYCLSASARRGEFRVIAVVLGEPSSATRNAEVVEMLNYAFSQYSAKTVYKKHQTVTLVPVLKGESQVVAVKASQPVTLLVKKSENVTLGHVVTEVHPLRAPVKKGQVAGYASVLVHGQTAMRIPLYAVADVPPVTWWEMLGRSMRQMFLLGIKG